MTRLKGYRTMLGLSQVDMAKLLNISRQTYSNKETGKVEFTDAEKRIIKAKLSELEVSPTIDFIFFE